MQNNIWTALNYRAICFAEKSSNWPLRQCVKPQKSLFYTENGFIMTLSIDLLSYLETLAVHLQIYRKLILNRYPAGKSLKEQLPIFCLTQTILLQCRHKKIIKKSKYQVYVHKHVPSVSFL